MRHERHARYWQRFLLPGEKMIHMFGVSGLYVATFWGGPLLLALVLAAMVGISNPVLGGLLLIVVATALIPIFYLFYFVHYAITDRRVMSREGIFHKRFVTVSLRSITDVSITEPFLQRLITHTGTIAVNTAGSPGVELYYRHVRHPFERRKVIYKRLQRVGGYQGPSLTVRRGSDEPGLT